MRSATTAAISRMGSSLAELPLDVYGTVCAAVTGLSMKQRCKLGVRCTQKKNARRAPGVENDPEGSD